MRNDQIWPFPRAAMPPLPGPLRLTPSFPFVGRARELAALREVLPRGGDDGTRSAPLGGEAGGGTAPGSWGGGRGPARAASSASSPTRRHPRGRSCSTAPATPSYGLRTHPW